MVDAIGAASTSSTVLATNPPSTSSPTDGAQPSAGVFNRRPEPAQKTSWNISSDGRTKLQEEQQKQRADTSDIDNSGLDDQTKNILKKIRELEQKVQDKVQELQQVMADKSLSEKARNQKVAVINAELASLQGAVSDATQALNEALAAAHASSDQRDMAHSLMHP
jgi:uncharacterized protein YoxC